MAIFRKNGKFKFPDGSIYEGDYKGTKKDGRGVYTFPDGEFYDGEFKDDLKEGQGIYSWPDGRRYEGSFRKDMMNGKGVYSCGDGTVYEGTWLNNEKHGIGKYIFVNGKYFICNFNHGLLDGEVRFYDSHGEFQNKVMVHDEVSRQDIYDKTGFKYFTPHGTAIAIDKSKYVGEHFNEMMNGNGIFRFSNGDIYSGEFVDNKKEGLGSYIWYDGRKYIGEFKDDVPHGNGHLEFSDNESVTAEFVEGQFINTRKKYKIIINRNMDIIRDNMSLISGYEEQFMSHSNQIAGDKQQMSTSNKQQAAGDG